jgi:hypothetical protein
MISKIEEQIKPWNISGYWGFGIWDAQVKNYVTESTSYLRTTPFFQATHLWEVLFIGSQLPEDFFT